MRRALALGACTGALLAGCGSREPATPVACLVEDQQAGELTRVGLALVRTATALNDSARQAPGGQANLALGFLVGAVEKGAEDTNGIHADLVRRIEAAAEFSPAGRPLPAAFRRSLVRGEQAGRGRG